MCTTPLGRAASAGPNVLNTHQQQHPHRTNLTQPPTEPRTAPKWPCRAASCAWTPSWRPASRPLLPPPPLLPPQLQRPGCPRGCPRGCNGPRGRGQARAGVPVRRALPPPQPPPPETAGRAPRPAAAACRWGLGAQRLGVKGLGLGGATSHVRSRPQPRRGSAQHGYPPHPFTPPAAHRLDLTGFSLAWLDPAPVGAGVGQGFLGSAIDWACSPCHPHPGACRRRSRAAW
jgi:hypothetical protein